MEASGLDGYKRLCLINSPTSTKHNRAQLLLLYFKSYRPMNALGRETRVREGISIQQYSSETITFQNDIAWTGE